MWAATGAYADDWVLDAKSSKIFFSSTKNSNIREDHSFQAMSGAVTAQGEASLRIDLHSVETLIPIRNERMRKLLFNHYPEAVFEAQLASDFATSSTMSHISGTLTLGGMTQTITADIGVYALSDTQMLVVTAKPIAISAIDYKLLPGIEALRAVAGLASIDPKVPVTFALFFERQ